MEELRGLLRDLQNSVSYRAVTKLNASNYAKWKREMQLYLFDSDLWDVVASPTPEASRDDVWRRRNNRALLELFCSCDSDQQNLVTSDTEAHALWVKLGQIYQAHDASSILRLFNEFTHMEIQKNE